MPIGVNKILVLEEIFSRTVGPSQTGFYYASLLASQWLE